MNRHKSLWLCLVVLCIAGTSCLAPRGSYHVIFYYGKVIDQYGQPVVGADVNGIVTVRQTFVDQKFEQRKTKTDENGLFEFSWLMGYGVGATPSKQGYLFGCPGAFGFDYCLRSIGGKTSPADRDIFTMWKCKGPEPMIHRQRFYQITPDNRIFTIDLLKPKIIEGTNSTGDFQIQIQRPATIGRQERFDWSFVMTANGGGFIEVTNKGYLNIAPENGYLPQYRFSMSAADEDKNWKQYVYSKAVGAKKTFYFKNRDGQFYGRFKLEVIPFFNDSSAIDLEYYLNPNASRILEWDGNMQLTEDFRPLVRH